MHATQLGQLRNFIISESARHGLKIISTRSDSGDGQLAFMRGIFRPTTCRQLRGLCAKRAVALKALARSKLGIPVGKAQLGKPEKVELKRALLADAKSILPSSMVHDPACRGVGGHLLRLLPFVPPVLRRVSEANGVGDDEGDEGAREDSDPSPVLLVGRMKVAEIQQQLKGEQLSNQYPLSFSR